MLATEKKTIDVYLDNDEIKKLSKPYNSWHDAMIALETDNIEWDNNA